MAMKQDVDPIQAAIHQADLSSPQAFHQLQAIITLANSIQQAQQISSFSHPPARAAPPVPAPTAPARSHVNPRMDLKRCQDCVDMLSAIIEVSENFEPSRDLQQYIYQLPPPLHTKNKKKKKKKENMMLMKALASPHALPFSSQDTISSKKKKPQRWLQKRLSALLDKAIDVYVSFMLHLEKRGDLVSVLAGGGHPMPPLPFSHDVHPSIHQSIKQ